MQGCCCCLPIPQDQSYHQFADQRAIFGIPNFWNVVSNLPFLVGRRGRVTAVPSRRGDGRFLSGRFPYRLRFVLLSLGSQDSTLFWDRLPMTLIFAALFALVVGERVSAAAGAVLLWPALAVGVFSRIAVALDRRSAALFLGAVLPSPRSR